MSLRATFSYFLFLAVFLFFVNTVFAPIPASAGLVDQISNSATNTLENAFNQTFSAADAVRTPTQVVGFVIKTMLAFVSVVFVVLVLYAGFTWMTARGNDEALTTAIGTLQTAIVGLVITMAAYVLAYFIFNVVLEATTGSSILIQAP